MKDDKPNRRGLSALLLLSAACILLSVRSVPALTTVRVVTGLTQPLFVTFSPADPDNRLFVVERGGRIRIVRDGQVTNTFLDLHSLVETGFVEQGLLGLAFHPNFVNNGLFYVDYTRAGDGWTVIAQYHVSVNPDSADPSSAQILLTIPQPYVNHNGGMLAFGADGNLYIGMGDGGSGGDPGNRAQSDTTLLGKILRINVNQLPYTIPPDNPFANSPGVRPEIWAKGLRNPWRFSFDRQINDLYIGDVGQDAWEEIDFQPSGSSGGENYGWRRMEGNHCYNPQQNCNPGNLVLPIHDYSHNLGCSISGGYVYRGSAIPDLQGTYFYADYCSARIWSFRYQNGTLTDFQERTAELAPGGGLQIHAISSFGEDLQGEFYICDLDAGSVFKIVSGLASDPVPEHSPSGDYRLTQNVPNPFNATTVIAFDLPATVAVRLTVFDILGQPVATLVNDTLPAGHHTVTFDGNRHPSGIYFYRIEAGRFATMRKMMLMK